MSTVYASCNTLACQFSSTHKMSVLGITIIGIQSSMERVPSLRREEFVNLSRQLQISLIDAANLTLLNGAASRLQFSHSHFPASNQPPLVNLHLIVSSAFYQKRTIYPSFSSSNGVKRFFLICVALTTVLSSPAQPQS